MKLHNTLSRSVEEFTPLEGNGVRMYSCGPTVYDRVHIGNLSSFIFADTLRRVLFANDNDVLHVMNITDIDDKTIRRSRESYHDLGAMAALLKLTTDCTNAFMEDMQSVGNDIAAIKFVKATDNIIAIQALIHELYKHGFAYVADDGVYFSIEAYKKSGKVYGQLSEITSSSTSNARIQNDEYDKESAHDFALWKTQKDGEPMWEYVLDGQTLDGRPGWHVECSVMSQSNLGQPFDIHTGGIDLIFPHHENEIAQSTASNSEPMYAHFFAHNAHLLVNGQKMSKSLQNFYTLKDIVDKSFDPLAFRVLVLQSHYRKQAHFSWENLQAAQNRLRDLQAMAALRWQAFATVHDAATFALEDIPLELTRVLSDDLNTPQALAYLSDVSTQLQAVLLEGNMIDHFTNMLAGIDKLLGLNLLEVADISAEQKQLIHDREDARDAKKWQAADELRDALLQQGLTLRDTSGGTIWSRL